MLLISLFFIIFIPALAGARFGRLSISANCGVAVTYYTPFANSRVRLSPFYSFLICFTHLPHMLHIEMAICFDLAGHFSVSMLSLRLRQTASERLRSASGAAVRLWRSPGLRSAPLDHFWADYSSPNTHSLLHAHFMMLYYTASKRCLQC